MLLSFESLTKSPLKSFVSITIPPVTSFKWLKQISSDGTYPSSKTSCLADASLTVKEGIMQIYEDNGLIFMSWLFTVPSQIIVLG